MKFSANKESTPISTTGTRVRVLPCVRSLLLALSLLLLPALSAQENDTPSPAAAPSIPAAPDPDSAAALDDIRDIRGPVEIPAPPNYGLWIAIFAAGVVAVISVNHLLRKKRPTVPLSAARKALAALDQSRAVIADQPGERFAVTVAGIVREYIAEQFGIAAPQRTTDEFLRQLNSSAPPDLARHAEPLSTFLRYCDLAKFGGQNASVDTALHQQLWQSARDFVDDTRRPLASSTTTTAAVSAETNPARQ